MIAFVGILTLCVLLSCMSSTALQPTTASVVYVQREAAAPNLNTLDIYAPETPGPHPVVMFVHGGGWANGDKKNVAAKAAWFVNAGYVFISTNYRVSPQVQHPAHVEDIAAAIAWTGKHIGDYKGDPKRIYLIGHSAGAHLVALVAIDQRYLVAVGADPSILRGVVPLDGAGYDIPTQYTRGGARVKAMYGQAFTTDVAKQRDASPIFKATPGLKSAPFLIVHAGDRAASGRQSKELAKALTDVGCTAETKHSPDDNHMTINRGFGILGDEVTAWVMKFFAQHP